MPDDAELAFSSVGGAWNWLLNRERIQDRVDGGDKDMFFDRCKSDGSDLAKTPFGATLTRLIARSYIGAANQYLVSGPASIGQSIADGAHSAHNYFKAGRDGLGVVSAARAADKAEKAAQMDDTESVCRDNGRPASKLRASSCTTRPWSTSFPLLLLETASPNSAMRRPPFYLTRTGASGGWRGSSVLRLQCSRFADMCRPALILPRKY